MDIKQFIFNDFTDKRTTFPSINHILEDDDDTESEEEQLVRSEEDAPDLPDEETSTTMEEVEAPPEPVIQPGFSEEDMQVSKNIGIEEGKQIGYEEGYQKAMKEVAEKNQAISDEISKTIEQLGINFTTFTKQYWDHQKDLEKKTILLANEIAMKLSLKYIEETAKQNITDTIKKLLPTISDEPQISIHIHPSMKQIITEHMDTIIASSPFWGEITINTDETLGISDVIIQWDNGSLEHSWEHIKNEISQLCENALNEI